MSIFFPRDEYFMRLALREAERALENEDLTVGVVYAPHQPLAGGAAAGGDGGGPRVIASEPL